MPTALEYFSDKLEHETDASDVYAAQRAGTDVVLVDVRGADAWAQARISGALHMPYRDIATRAAVELSRDAEIVVYCWSPGCNAGAKGAREFAKLGYRVREMIGGFEYWVREGQPTENDDGRVCCTSR